jgi:hypothetical protein
MLIFREIYELGKHDDIPGPLVPSTFSEENSFLDADNMIILKFHCMKCYSPLCKELLDNVEELMTQDSLVGSTVCTRSKKCGSVVSRMFSPSVNSVNTKTSKASESSNQRNFRDDRLLLTTVLLSQKPQSFFHTKAIL